MLMHHICVYLKGTYISEYLLIIIDVRLSLLIYNSLDLGLHQISTFLVTCMIKIANWCFRFGLAFFAPWVFFLACTYTYICVTHIHIHILDKMGFSPLLKKH